LAGKFSRYLLEFALTAEQVVGEAGVGEVVNSGDSGGEYDKLVVTRSLLGLASTLACNHLVHNIPVPFQQRARLPRCGSHFFRVR
jgi:hypothetical protein